VACWAKEIWSRHARAQHVRWAVPVECMMALLCIFSSRGREEGAPAHQRCFSGCLCLIARLMRESAATPELSQAGGLARSGGWLAAGTNAPPPASQSCVFETSTTLPLQHNPCTARLSPDYPHAPCSEASPVPTTAPTSQHRQISPTTAIPKDSPVRLRHLQRRVEISLLPNPPIPVVAHPPDPAANYSGNLLGNRLRLLLMLT
jgi:hypothetical protein